ncbi:hypothetical protein [Actinoplanes subglobosus]|uniref:Gram-positive cocci surface proteins LPxTG domain-containing protein n=1 Tax=Actinoplanes subglobosus TaxID=1547892 RepID=A0ABV8IIT0_9ACTN
MTPPACGRPAHYAAQSSAELLRIDRLDLGSGTAASSGKGGAAESRGGPGGAGANPIVGGVGLGESRAVLIADGKVNSGSAARTLNGKVAGSKDRADLVLQKAPPVSPQATSRRTGSKRFGPMRVGDGKLSARAVWAHGMACGNAVGDTSSASAEISRVTLAGGGSAALARVPEKVTSRSGTAMRLHGGAPQSVASATITAGRISLVDNEVRIRVLRAPQLRVSMTAAGRSRVDYQPAVVEVTGTNSKRTRLTTPGDHIDITLSNEMRPLESLPPRLEPIGDLPLPKVSDLPVTEQTPTPGNEPGSTLRISLGEVRQATRGKAIAARVTAIRVILTRNVDSTRPQTGIAPSSVAADLGIGMLTAAAVAPHGKTSGKPGPTSTKGHSSGWGNAADSASPHGTPSQSSTKEQNTHNAARGSTPVQASRAPKGDTAAKGDTAGRGATAGRGSTATRGHATRGDTSSRGDVPSQNGTPGDADASPGKASSSTDLPLTGPRVVSLLIAGSTLIIVGVAAVVLSSRRRKRT